MVTTAKSLEDNKRVFCDECGWTGREKELSKNMSQSGNSTLSTVSFFELVCPKCLSKFLTYEEK